MTITPITPAPTGIYKPYAELLTELAKSYDKIDAITDEIVAHPGYTPESIRAIIKGD